MKVKLFKFPYKYMEYENQLLELTIKSRFSSAEVKSLKNGFELKFADNICVDEFKDIPYVYKVQIDECSITTLQGKLEYSRANPTDNRQGTRYSTHGLHEYKGKYNPQIVKGALDYMGVGKSAYILDPFCGSGTTMVECVHHGYPSLGTDINPMAVFISNTKIQSLRLDINYLKRFVNNLVANGIKYELSNPTESIEFKRLEYLKKWIPDDTLRILEGTNEILLQESEDIRNFVRLTMSDLIRDYSNQEPSDLRIRKRSSPFPEMPFLEMWKQNTEKYIESIKGAQKVKKYDIDSGKAVLCDIRGDYAVLENEQFDAIITSPPYATALPYIDTQRISLVWLRLCSPEQIMSLESSLIGSREFVSAEKKRWIAELETNREELPDEINELVDKLFNDLQPTDGFRKQAVPILLYRYFVDMKRMFVNTHSLIKEGGKFGLVVGNNKTTIGGEKRMIDTPRLLSLIASECGWKVDELFPLQTYKRYGINSKNAINTEILIILHK